MEMDGVRQFCCNDCKVGGLGCMAFELAGIPKDGCLKGFIVCVFCVSYFRVIDMQERNCLIQGHETVAQPKILCCVVLLHISVNIMNLNIHCCFVDNKIEAFAFSAVQVMTA